MDQNQAPVLDASAEHQKLGRYGFTPPAHRQERGTDPRVLAVLGDQSFRSDVVASSGLESRAVRHGAQFPFTADTPTQAMSAGADICVVSVHKMGMGFEQGRIDMGTADHRRTEAVISVADDQETTARLLSGLRALSEAAPDLPRPSAVDYLRSGVQAGMVPPDPANPTLRTIRVVREQPRRSQ